MRYAQVIPFDVCNGKGIGLSLFVQGCSFHCYNCFNQNTWDYTEGKEWNEDTKQKFFDLISRHYIKRVSILGGEPLAEQNRDEVISLAKTIKEQFPNKKIWIFSGYKLEEILNSKAQDILLYTDVLVDGRYIDNLKDITLAFRGSSNQRIIDVQKSLSQDQIVLYDIN